MQTDGQTDKHGEANSRFSQFCERAQKLWKLFVFTEYIQRVHHYDRYTNEDVSSQLLHGAVRRDRIARVDSALVKMCGSLQCLRADLRLPLTPEIKSNAV